MLRPLACLVDDPPESVAEFIDTCTASWNDEKLRQYFLSMDVDIIKEIPICNRRYVDFWARHYDRRGLFSVRSAYKMLIATREKREAWLANKTSGSEEGRTAKEWSSLWNTQVSSKFVCSCGD